VSRTKVITSPIAGIEGTRLAGTKHRPIDWYASIARALRITTTTNTGSAMELLGPEELNRVAGGRDDDQDYGWCTYNRTHDYVYQWGRDYGVAGELAGMYVGGLKAYLWDCL
jgi:hypothetical protein